METKKNPRSMSPSDFEMVKGDLEPATREGFVALMKKANVFLTVHPNYRLVTIVRLEKAIASVFVAKEPSRGPNITEFWDENDNEV